MADDPKQSNFANNSLILAALISTGAFIFNQNTAPLRDARPPPSPSQLRETVEAQDLDARLWQDPFSVVAKAAGDAAGDCPDALGVRHCDAPLVQLGTRRRRCPSPIRPGQMAA